LSPWKPNRNHFPHRVVLEAHIFKNLDFLLWNGSVNPIVSIVKEFLIFAIIGSLITIPKQWGLVERVTSMKVLNVGVSSMSRVRRHHFNDILRAPNSLVYSSVIFF
jgi:hypothetical protein